MTNLKAIPSFEEPSLSDIYMSDYDDEDEDCMSIGSVGVESAPNLFEVYRPMSTQKGALIAEMPAKSKSKIQTHSQTARKDIKRVVHRNDFSKRQSLRVAQTAQHRHQQQQQQQQRSQKRISSIHNTNNKHSLKKKNHRDNDYDVDLEMNYYGGIYSRDPLEAPSNAPTSPTIKQSLSLSPSRSVELHQKKETERQRGLYLCVVSLAFLFLLFGILVAIVGHILLQEEQPQDHATSTLSKGGSLSVMPIALPNITTSITQTSMELPFEEPSRNSTIRMDVTLTLPPQTSDPSMQETTEVTAEQIITLQPTESSTLPPV